MGRRPMSKSDEKSKCIILFTEIQRCEDSAFPIHATLIRSLTLWSFSTAVLNAARTHLVAVPRLKPRSKRSKRASSSASLELGPNLERQPDQWRASRQPSWSLAWLLPREAPSKMGFGVVDAVSIPTPTCPLDAIRARAELCLLHVHAPAKSACCTCVSAVVC